MFIDFRLHVVYILGLMPNKYATICGSTEASIFFSGSSVISVTSFIYTERNLPIHIYDLNCTGNEESVWECPQNGIQGYFCGYNRGDARLICSGKYAQMFWYSIQNFTALSFRLMHSH